MRGWASGMASGTKMLIFCCVFNDVKTKKKRFLQNDRFNHGHGNEKCHWSNSYFYVFGDFGAVGRSVLLSFHRFLNHL